jgi:hypothetical protein
MAIQAGLGLRYICWPEASSPQNEQLVAVYIHFRQLVLQRWHVLGDALLTYCPDAHANAQYDVLPSCK